MNSLIEKVRIALSQRRVYNRVVAEIAKMDDRELADLRTDRGALVARAYSDVYGIAI